MLKILYLFAVMGIIDNLRKFLFRKHIFNKYRSIDEKKRQNIIRHCTKFANLYKMLSIPTLVSILIVFTIFYFFPSAKDFVHGGFLAAGAFLLLSCEFVWRQALLKQLMKQDK